MDANLRRNIKGAINGSPRNGYVAELHAQVLKHAAELQNVTGEEFCEMMEIPAEVFRNNKAHSPYHCHLPKASRSV